MRAETTTMSPHQDELSPHTAAALARAEELRGDTIRGVAEYQNRMEQELAAVRGQRAWKVMLALRKTYSLLTRRGWAGKWELARSLVTFRFARDLRQYDLQFPDIGRYLPEDLHRPLAEGRPGAASWGESSGNACDLFVIQDAGPMASAVTELERAGHRVFRIDPSASNAEAFRKTFAEAGIAESCVLVDDVAGEQIASFLSAGFGSRTVRGRANEAAICAAFPRASVLIITFNSAEFIGECLRSVFENTAWPNLEVLVVDNGSTDGTQKILRESAGREARLRLELLSTNLGFAGGNNLAVSRASGENYILLNADTLVTRGWLHRLMRRVETDAGVGMVSAVTNFAGNEVKINVPYTNASGMRAFARRLALDRAGETLPLRVAPLFCTLIPRDVWERVGPLDPEYQIGMFEDDDLSYRMRQAGFRIVAAEDCFVHHFGEGSFAQLEDGEYRRIFEENRRRFERKWGVRWERHQTRAHVKPAAEEPRFRPREFNV